MVKEISVEEFNSSVRTSTAFTNEFIGLLDGYNNGSYAELDDEETENLMACYVGSSKSPEDAVSWGIARYLKSKGLGTETECKKRVHHNNKVFRINFN